jgi:hypothetical protein
MSLNKRRQLIRALYAVPLGLLMLSSKRSEAGDKTVDASQQNILATLLAKQAETEARQQITDLLYRYARGWDRLDEEALRSCFFADSGHQHGAFKGKSHDFITAGMKGIRAKVKSTTHMIANPLIEIAGDKAFSECLFLAHHRRMNSEGTDEEDYFLKGRYLDRLERRNGEWKIAFRRGLHDFERVVPRADRTLANAPADQLSARKPDDPLYAMLADFHSGK